MIARNSKMKENRFYVRQDLECCATCDYVHFTYDGQVFCNNQANWIRTNEDDETPEWLAAHADEENWAAEVEHLGLCKLYDKAIT